MDCQLLFLLLRRYTPGKHFKGGCLKCPLFGGLRGHSLHSVEGGVDFLSVRARGGALQALVGRKDGREWVELSAKIQRDSYKPVSAGREGPYIRSFPHSSQTGSPSGDQMFEHMNLGGTVSNFRD